MGWGQPTAAQENCFAVDPSPIPHCLAAPFYSKAETDGTAAVPWQGWQKSGERWEDSHSPAEGQSPAENPINQEG